MTHREFTFYIYNKQVYGQYWQPKTPVKAAVILIHGMGEHSGRYAEFVVPKLVEIGCAVLSYDQFGHGKTQGKKGHTPSYKALLNCVDVVIDKAKESYPEAPIFLYGHSMGGNVVMNYSLRRNGNIRGVIATSPFLELAFQPPKWKLSLGRLFLKLWPSITLPSELDVNAISQLPEEVDKYVNDEMVHDKVSPNYTFPIMDAGQWVIENASKLSAPMLLLHGTGDRITNHKATKQFAANTSMAKLHLIDDGYHELHNDVEREHTLQLITNWLKEQLS